jgi:hypothetical protein
MRRWVFACGRFQNCIDGMVLGEVSACSVVFNCACPAVVLRGGQRMRAMLVRFACCVPARLCLNRLKFDSVKSVISSGRRIGIGRSMYSETPLTISTAFGEGLANSSTFRYALVRFRHRYFQSQASGRRSVLEEAGSESTVIHSLQLLPIDDGDRSLQ